MSTSRSNKSTVKEKVILGIDPGSTTIGFGVIKYKKNDNNPKLVTFGYVDLSAIKDDAKRLVQLNKDIASIIKKHKPDAVAIESLFYFKNLKTFSPVLQSRGVIMFTVAKEKIKIFEYTPLQVKQTISGYGKADKKMVEKLVKSILGIKQKIRPDDASDALAIALCHMRQIL